MSPSSPIHYKKFVTWAITVKAHQRMVGWPLPQLLPMGAVYHLTLHLLLLGYWVLVVFFSITVVLYTPLIFTAVLPGPCHTYMICVNDLFSRLCLLYCVGNVCSGRQGGWRDGYYDAAVWQCLKASPPLSLITVKYRWNNSGHTGKRTVTLPRIAHLCSLDQVSVWGKEEFVLGEWAENVGVGRISVMVQVG